MTFGAHALVSPRDSVGIVGDPSISTSEEGATIMSPRVCSAVAIIGLVLVACNQSEPTDIKSLLASDRPSPPQVVAHLPLEGSPFGSAVSSAGVGWIAHPDPGRAPGLDMAPGPSIEVVAPGPAR